jgi:hypothetical protein
MNADERRSARWCFYQRSSAAISTFSRSDARGSDPANSDGALPGGLIGLGCWYGGSADYRADRACASLLPHLFS